LKTCKIADNSTVTQPWGLYYKTLTSIIVAA
jgi:hypothetical protein